MLEGPFARFAALDPIAPSDLRGRWRGEEVPSGHPMDGLLTASGWYGKVFRDDEAVFPLVFWTARRTGLFAAHPGRLWDLPVPAHSWVAVLIRLGRPYWGTTAPTARLRTVVLDGVASAAMVYDHRPIIDHFRRIDADTVLGRMDRRGDAAPYWFTLHRDDTPLAMPDALRVG